MANFSFTDFFTDIGNGLGAFLEAIQGPLVQFVLVLFIGLAVGGVVYAIVDVIRKSTNKMTVRK